MLLNYTETAVLELLDTVLAKYKETHPNVCCCNRCREDVMAIALNNIPPHYVATETGKVLKRVSFDRLGGKAQVIAQIMRALDIVSNNPRH